MEKKKENKMIVKSYSVTANIRGNCIDVPLLKFDLVILQSAPVHRQSINGALFPIV